MKIKNPLCCVIFSLVSLSCVHADVPPTTLYVDVCTPDRQTFQLNIRAGNTPSIVVVCQSNLVAYTNFGTGWTPFINYGVNDSASSLKTVTGVLAAATGVITFDTVTNSFPSAGDYFSEIYLNNGTSPKLTIAQGALTITRSPSSGSYGDLNLNPRINWDIIQNLGTVPWAAGAEPVYTASIAYNITAAMTDNWTTAYGYSTQITALETGRVTLASYNAFTNAQVNTNAALLGLINAISNVVPTGAVSEVTYNAHVAAQASTNAAFSALHTAQAATNAAYTALFVLQAATNASVTAKIGTNDTFRAAQANTNAAFSVLHTAQASTNAGFEVRIASNENGVALLKDTNTDFQALFDAQVNTNTELQGYITTNLAGQLVTNAWLIARIWTNEYFRITTQPATNVALLLQITNNVATQASTNAGFEVRIASNEAFNVAQGNTNAEYQTFITAQGNTNSAFEIRIASNDLFRSYTQPLTNASLLSSITANYSYQTNVNTGFVNRITSNETFNTAQANTNTIFRAFDAAQVNTNAGIDARVTSLEGSSIDLNRFNEMTIANIDLVSSNITGLTNTTYTGSISSVSYTGHVATVVAKTYAWGFYKQNAFGTGTLTLAGATMTVTNSGLSSNQFFTALTTDTNMILRIDGNGSSKSDISNTFVRLITNGTLNAAVDVVAPLGTFKTVKLLDGASIDYVWTCTNTTTGEGAWSAAGSGDMLEADYATNGTAGQVDLAARAVTADDSITNAYSTSGTTNNAELDGRMVKVTFATSTTMHRTTIRTNANEEIHVIASSTNVTASRTSTTITLTPAVGTVLNSATINWNAPVLGASYTLVVGTNDMLNTSAANRGCNTFAAYRIDTGDEIRGASSRPDPVNFDRFIVGGLDIRAVCICIHNF